LHLISQAPKAPMGGPHTTFNRAPGPYHAERKSNLYGSENSFSTHSTERPEISGLYSAADRIHRDDGKRKAAGSIRKAPGPYNAEELKGGSIGVKGDPAGYGPFSDRSSDMPSFTGNDDYKHYMGSNLFNSHGFPNTDHSYFTDQGNPRK